MEYIIAALIYLGLISGPQEYNSLSTQEQAELQTQIIGHEDISQ